MRQILVIALAFALWTPPADASCMAQYAVLCDMPYVLVVEVKDVVDGSSVAEITKVLDNRSEESVTEGLEEPAPKMGETLKINVLDTDRTGDLIVWTGQVWEGELQGQRQGKIIDGRVDHYGASLTMEQIASLHAQPDTCRAELDKLGGQEPSCNDTGNSSSGCASAGAMTAFALVSLLVGRRRRRGWIRFATRTLQMRQILVIALACALWTPPVGASEPCPPNVHEVLCTAPYVVAEVEAIGDEGTRLSIVEEYGHRWTSQIGEKMWLSSSDTDRVGDLFVVMNNMPEAKLIDGRFDHFGASLTIEQLESLRAQPDTCVAELNKLGGEAPPCPKLDFFACASEGAMTAFALVSLLVGWRRRRG